MKNKTVIIGLVILALIVVLHPLPRNTIRCGRLPVFATKFAASYSYTSPKSGVIYLIDSALPVFSKAYCSEDEAKKAGFRPGAAETKITTSDSLIDFSWYLPGQIEKTYPYYWLTYTEGEFHAILTDTPIRGEVITEPKRRLDVYIAKPTDYNPPGHCGSFAPMDGSPDPTGPEREKCVFVVKTPGGHEVYRGAEWKDTYYTIHDGLLVYLTFKDNSWRLASPPGVSGSRSSTEAYPSESPDIATITKMVDGLRPLTETERRNVEVSKNFKEEPK